jgi:hypothetical protein
MTRDDYINHLNPHTKKKKKKKKKKKFHEYAKPPIQCNTNPCKDVEGNAKLDFRTTAQQRLCQ